jgi:hypothetical protein
MTRAEENEVIIRNVIPAQPGWVVAYYDPSKHAFFYEPIIAWAIEAIFREPNNVVITEAVTVHGEVDIYFCERPWGSKDSYRTTGVKSPDGRIDFPGVCGFDNEARALDAIAEELKKKSA